MNMIESAVDGIPLIVIEGELDHSSKQMVLDAITGLFHGAYPPTNLLVDLTDCAFIDSGGLSVLLSALVQLPPHGWLGIVGPQPDPTACSNTPDSSITRRCVSSPP